MAQTTPDASFGPVFVVSVHPVVYFIFKPLDTVSLLDNMKKKNERKQKKTHLGPKRHQMHRLGQFSLILR